MNNFSQRILGIMSGSSLDGVDIAVIRFDSLNTFEWQETTTVPYPAKWKEHLSNANLLKPKDLFALQTAYTQFQAKLLSGFELSKLDAIAWHGHTLLHEPKRQYSFQLGDPQLLASVLGVPTFGHFRQADLARGGQGAPLAPIVDYHFFKEYDCCINLGGIANISFPSMKKAAFDICGFNQVLNSLSAEFGDSMDRDGQYSAKGSIDHELLTALEKWTFLEHPAPKSLSNQEVQSFYFRTLMGSDASTSSKMKTFLKHVCLSIQRSLDAGTSPEPKVLLTGGGSMNCTFVEMLEQHLPKGEITVIEEPWRSYKEAFLMSFMGYLKAINRPNVLSSSTGVAFDQITGILYQP